MFNDVYTTQPYDGKPNSHITIAAATHVRKRAEVYKRKEKTNKMEKKTNTEWNVFNKNHREQTSDGSSPKILGAGFQGDHGDWVQSDQRCPGAYR